MPTTAARSTPKRAAGKASPTPRAKAKSSPRSASKSSATPTTRTPRKSDPKTAPKAAPRKAAPRPKTRRANPAPETKTAGTKPARRRTSRAPKPKGLEALYSGKVFRSRLEARWAVFLDLLEINWDYEPSHYQVGPELFYLPDFYLPDHQLWLEVKGSAFMDAQSVAKCLASVAGPSPLPLREAPYTAADRLLIGGSMHPKAGFTPQHTLVTRTADGKAGLSYALISRRGLHQAGPNWDAVEATGIAKARRPAPAVIKSLVEPPPFVGVHDTEAHSAYRIAAAIAFDDSTKALSKNTDRELAHILGRRRAGRPLGPFVVSQAVAA